MTKLTLWRCPKCFAANEMAKTKCHRCRWQRSLTVGRPGKRNRKVLTR